MIYSIVILVLSVCALALFVGTAVHKIYKKRKPIVYKHKGDGLIAIAAEEDYKEVLAYTKGLSLSEPVVMRVATFSPLGALEQQRPVTGTFEEMDLLLWGCRVLEKPFFVPGYGERRDVQVLTLNEAYKKIWKGRRKPPQR